MMSKKGDCEQLYALRRKLGVTVKELLIVEWPRVITGE
jgi:hypothetical protein